MMQEAPNKYLHHHRRNRQHSSMPMACKMIHRAGLHPTLRLHFLLTDLILRVFSSMRTEELSKPPLLILLPHPLDRLSGRYLSKPVLQAQVHKCIACNQLHRQRITSIFLIARELHRLCGRPYNDRHPHKYYRTIDGQMGNLMVVAARVMNRQRR